MKLTAVTLTMAAVAGVAAIPAMAEAKTNAPKCVAVTQAQVDGLFKEFNDGFQTRNPDVVKIGRASCRERV